MKSDSENFCLQWNDFVKNVTSSVSESRTTVEFTDVTLACGDGQEIKGHKLILASGSFTFKDLLKENPNPNMLSQRFASEVDCGFHLHG